MYQILILYDLILLISESAYYTFMCVHSVYPWKYVKIVYESVMCLFWIFI
jgi:hypothetical protein